MSQGPIERTNNPLDVAINGKGFLVVQTPRGERYTRNGALQINNTGELVTSEGYQVLGDSGPITFQPKDRSITISEDGTISAREGSNTNRLSTRPVAHRRASTSPASCRRTEAAPSPRRPTSAPQADKTSRIVQGAVEKSNVRGVIEMSRMIEVTRNYTQVATHAAAGSSDMRRTAIEKLADVPN